MTEPNNDEQDQEQSNTDRSEEIKKNAEDRAEEQISNRNGGEEQES